MQRKYPRLSEWNVHRAFIVHSEFTLRLRLSSVRVQRSLIVLCSHFVHQLAFGVQTSFTLRLVSVRLVWIHLRSPFRLERRTGTVMIACQQVNYFRNVLFRQRLSRRKNLLCSVILICKNLYFYVSFLLIDCIDCAYGAYGFQCNEVCGHCKWKLIATSFRWMWTWVLGNLCKTSKWITRGLNKYQLLANSFKNVLTCTSQCPHKIFFNEMKTIFFIN